MAIASDLEKAVVEILSTNWKERDGTKVPEAEDVKLGNDAVKLSATVLYADLAESTALVERYKPWFAAEIYKSYLHCATKVIRDEGGVVTSFDGDRVMGVFIGGSKCTSAARSALKINHAVIKIVNEQIAKKYPDNPYVVKQAVGVDTSDLFIARTGIRGSNDLVWVGRAANYAAKLCSLRSGSAASWITADVFDNLHESVRLSSDGQSMWTKQYWGEKGIYVYSSTWMWSP